MTTYDPLLKGKAGEKLFLLGNEAIARGVIEAGIALASTYPGTPSSEVGDVLYEIGQKAGLKFEFSVNEKVAMETAFAASASGLKSFVFMKHVGLNVASDVLMSISYTGVKGPMVIMSADDPSMFSSQNEQDNRHYGHLAHIPVIEPSNPQEAKDFFKEAVRISAIENLPVLFRTTTRISHMRAEVELGPVDDINHDGHLDRKGRSYVSLPVNAYGYKEELIQKMESVKGKGSSSPLNRLEGDRKSPVGIITSGEAYNVVKDVLYKNDSNPEILKLGLTNPIPEELVLDFMKRHHQIVVVEEVDPIIESDVRNLAQMHLPDAVISGKLNGIIPMSHETSPDTLEVALSPFLNFSLKDKNLYVETMELPPRAPVLCAGCPHRATYFAVRRAVKMAGINDPVYSADIGCYSLGNYEPFEEADILLEMGSSIGAGNGISRSTDQTPIAFIGDSTFFHAGIPPLVNAVKNGSRMTVVIMDNDVTAMTGRQPNPGTPLNLAPSNAANISIQKVVEALGIGYVRTVDPYNLKETLAALMGALKYDGVSVVIAKRECAIIRDNRMKKDGTPIAKYQVNQEKCASCYKCVENFACPAISIEEGKAAIDPVLCNGCGVCTQPYVCPFGAMEVREDAN